jgi:hypothetical protein
VSCADGREKTPTHIRHLPSGQWLNGGTSPQLGMSLREHPTSCLTAPFFKCVGFQRGALARTGVAHGGLRQQRRLVLLVLGRRVTQHSHGTTHEQNGFRQRHGHPTGQRLQTDLERCTGGGGTQLQTLPERLRERGAPRRGGWRGDARVPWCHSEVEASVGSAEGLAAVCTMKYSRPWSSSMPCSIHAESCLYQTCVVSHGD